MLIMPGDAALLMIDEQELVAASQSELSNWRGERVSVSVVAGPRN